MADWHLWLPPALAKPRFRIYAAGHTVSVIGSWIQQVALAWLVFRLTQSIFLLGVTGFLLNIFYLLLGPVGGLTADRLPRLKLLIGIDLFLAACSALLAVMAAAGVTNIAVYLAIAALIGIANAFEMPVRQTLIRVIVEERALVTSALGVSAMVFNIGRMVGPAIAGLVLAYVSEAWCFALNAVCYGGIIAALLAMRLPSEPPRHAPSGAALQGFAASLSVLFAFPAVRYLLPTVVAIGLFATPYVPLMPSIATHFFDGQSSTVGLLMSAAGVGALIAAGYLSLQPGYGRQLRLMTLAPLAVGLALGAVCLVAHAAPVDAAAGGAGRRRDDRCQRHQRHAAAVGAGRVARPRDRHLQHVVRRHGAAGRAALGLDGRPHRPDHHPHPQRRAHRRSGAGRALAPAQPPRGPARPHAQLDPVGVLRALCAEQDRPRRCGSGKVIPSEAILL